MKLLYQVSTNKKNYFFDSLQNANTFIESHKDTFRSMTPCYAEEHNIDGISYYYLAKAEPEIKGLRGSKNNCYKIGGIKYDVDPALLKKENGFHNVLVIKHVYYINDEYPRYPHCSAASIQEIDPSESCAQHKNSEKKKLLLTDHSIQFFSIDRENKLFLGEVTSELQDKMNEAFYEKIRLFKTERKVLIQDIESKKAKVEKLDEEIGFLEKESGRRAQSYVKDMFNK